ncbi:4-carboxymuconolactone decarboxylase [Natronorubrum sediminis]|uniref:4-carboxymuconolactone decarboxylase n=1 Tax=Natronorubrum sediminis TaxID=640943 RepID=A0A1H6FRC3_9EURY|nr:carboxymuconolactone decarboxylase family protein [Natronorubrum sediminis]SEH13451.1 4-carboxymuconolactone decarboxylase [Natronorubrum sediminis]
MADNDSPRVPFIASKAAIPEDQYHNYDKIVDSRGDVIGPFGVLLNSPEVAGRAGHLGTYIRFDSVLPDDVRELAILTTAREFDCPFEWAVHEPIARDAGVSDEAIEAVRERVAVDGLSSHERRIVTFGRQLFETNEVDDEHFEAAADQFGTTGVTELVATFGYYSMLAVVLNALEVAPDEDAPSLG